MQGFTTILSGCPRRKSVCPSAAPPAPEKKPQKREAGGFLYLLDTVPAICYIESMETIQAYIWKGQALAMARYARENRESLMNRGDWDGRGDPPPNPEMPTTIEKLIEESFVEWLQDDCPPIDWRQFPMVDDPKWGPVASNSTRKKFQTGDPRMFGVVQTLKEYSSWLGRGCRIGSVIPARATLAVVGQFMVKHKQGYHSEIEYDEQFN